MTTTYWKSASRLTLIATVAATLAGCSSTALPPGRSVLEVSEAKNNTALASQQNGALAVHPSGFEWAPQTLQATGHGAQLPGMTGPQSDLAASNSAKAHALVNLKSQVKRLPVGSDQTVGSIMDTYITVRHAVDQEIASAQVLATRPLPDGRTEVQVGLPMQNIATILQQYQITPDQELPQTAEVNPAVPDMI